LLEGEFPVYPKHGDYIQHENFKYGLVGEDTIEQAQGIQIPDSDE
jgi:hypothetical protein